MRKVNPWRAVPTAIIVTAVVLFSVFLCHYVIGWMNLLKFVGVLALIALAFTIHAWWTEKADAWDKRHGVPENEPAENGRQTIEFIEDEHTGKPPVVVPLDIGPHCDSHKSFDYDCLDCSDALEAHRAAQARAKLQAHTNDVMHGALTEEHRPIV